MKYKLKLVKGMSYNGIVSATKKNPCVTTEDKKVADKAVATGYFVLEETIKDVTSPFDKMSVPELKKFAEENNINIDGLSGKHEIIKAIESAQAQNQMQN